MNKTMGVSPVTDTIYYGTVKNDMWQGKKEDVTDIAIKAVFEWFVNKFKSECPPDGVYQISFPGVPYVLEKYSTLEKAIKVLDMIQKEYENSLYSEFMTDTTGSKLPRIYVNNKVFQMPQDSEVE